MQESDTYLAIVEEGQEKQSRRLLLQLGTKRSGPASPDVINRVQAVTELERLERMVSAVLDASDWNDILATP